MLDAAMVKGLTTAEVGPVYAPESLPIARIVSGGQTGADRGGLDAAAAVGLPTSGWCPKGRRAEDGAIPPHYLVRELDTRAYAQRTERNVVDSDATVIFSFGPPTGGSKKTVALARRHGRPHLSVDLAALRTDTEAAAAILAWWRTLGRDRGLVLNVAGSRESKAPGIQARVARILGIVLEELDGLPCPRQWELREGGAATTGTPPATTRLPLVGDLAAGWPFDGFDVERLQDAENWVDVPPDLARPGRFVVEVAGESMLPDFAPGDQVVCEFHRTPRRQDQVVIMARFGAGTDRGEFALKRFRDTPDAWLFRSDNPAHADIPIPKSDQPAHPILGIALHNLTRNAGVR
jgi:SOS-response transcriptional repressor LexA